MLKYILYEMGDKEKAAAMAIMCDFLEWTSLDARIHAVQLGPVWAIVATGVTEVEALRLQAFICGYVWRRDEKPPNQE